MDDDLQKALNRRDEMIALHLQKGEMRDKQGRIVGWRTCDCRACTIVGRSPAGPDFRYEEFDDDD